MRLFITYRMTVLICGWSAVVHVDEFSVSASAMLRLAGRGLVVCVIYICVYSLIN